ncbi:MAG: peptidoglycan DD-metalloendopeptidase family protein [Lachnospiraceae bacterium]|nr:peptidoglycan DD-metalloendopeptidase family protein [Lachnospiraceae bacterium]
MCLKKSLRGIILLLLVAVLAVSICPAVSRADEISQLEQSIKDKQAAISQAENERKELQTGVTNVEKVIANLQTTKNNLANYVTQLDVTLSDVQSRIVDLKDKITTKEAEIVQINADLEDALATEQQQYESMKTRIRFMYENDNSNILELIFESKSFADFLNKADYVEQLSAYDRKMLNQYTATREYVEVCKLQLETEQQLLQETKLEVEKEEASLQTLITEKEKEINAYEQDIDDQETMLAAYEAEIAAQNAEIEALEAAVAADKAALEEAKRRKYDGGKFAWPAPSYTRISDDYGYRIHPILKVKQFHNGVDMAAPGGSPILAAYDGVVVAASYSSSMGNYVMIDHGDELYTIYMHASKLYVKKGQEVTRGEKIAAVGTTGRSTGNHLHFGVRLNGKYVSPWDYFGS